MKKILFILMMLVCGFASAQVSFIGQATTVQRDGLTIPAGRYAVLYNSTTGQFERWNGSSWERWTAGILTGDITDGTIGILDLDAPLQTSVGLADTSTQPGDNISTLTNDSGFIGTTSFDTFAELDAIVADKSLVNTADAQTLTNKTIAFGSNTLSNVLSTNTAQSITGAKTFGYGQILLSGFTSGTLNLVPADAVASGTASIPSGTLITQTSTNTLTNKTLTSPVINTGIIGDVTSGGNITSTNYLVGATATQTLTNKTISGASNTITNIGSASITDGSIDILDTDAGIQTSLGLADTALQSADIDTYTELNTTVADVTLTHNGLIDTSAEIATIVTDETGSGSLVFSNSPTLVTPALGTPSSATLTNATGLPGSGIVAGSIEADRLEATNSPTDGQIYTYDAVTGGGTWEAGPSSAISYSYQTLSASETFNDADVVSGISRRWNKVSTNDSITLDATITNYGIPFIVESTADSVYIRKGTGTTFYVEGQSTGITQSGVSAATRSPMTVIAESSNVYSIYGNYKNLITEITSFPWLIDGYWGSIGAEGNAAYADETPSGVYLDAVASFGGTQGSYTADPYSGTYSLSVTATDGNTDRIRIGVYGLTNGEVYEFTYRYKMVTHAAGDGGRVTVQNGDLSFPISDYGLTSTTWVDDGITEFTYTNSTNNFIYINIYANATTNGGASDVIAVEFDLRQKFD